jgi:opacity protein-like surface antigen
MIKRTTVLFSLAALVSIGSASVAQAQVANPLKFTVFAGAAVPTGDTRDEVKTGYTVGGAVDFHVPLSPFGLRGELAYASADAKETGGLNDLDLSDLGANANAVFWLPNGVSPVRPYVTGGASYSRLKYSAKDGGVTGSIEDNGFGFNVGGGLDFALGSLSTRLDVRYKRISIDNFADSGESVKASYIPITFGLTF